MQSQSYRPLSLGSLDPDQMITGRPASHRRTAGEITIPITRGAMSEVGSYTAREFLGDGSQIEIRALRREDEADMLAAVERTSAQSLQRRFFVMKRHFSDKERAFFLDIDFRNHVAIVALADEAGHSVIAGGGRYIVFEPGRAEMAFVVVDTWQGRGIGSILMRHLVGIARAAGLQELTAEVLPENAAMIKVFGKFGFSPAPRLDPQTLHLVLRLA
jgi:GNAT superfamily N-acetyltransferase